MYTFPKHLALTACFFICLSTLLTCLCPAQQTVLPADRNTEPTTMLQPEGRSETIDRIKKDGPPTVRICQLIQDRNRMHLYPYALPSLLQDLSDRTALNMDPQPIIISSFEDPQLFDAPLLYVNFGQRTDWNLTPAEIKNLRNYLDRGGFMLIDAGISAEFLRDKAASQHHSFAEWQARPELVEVMERIYPGRTFDPLPRDHELYRIFYQGLPDPTILPDTVREFVVNEKWPNGTYSMVAMKVNGRISVLATPIVAMGWGKTPLGTWATTIGFRIRESAEKLDERLQTAAYSGVRFEVTREDGQTDIVFCQEEAKPSWVHEANGTYRVFRYYHSREISEYAHQFYTQLGFNIFVYAMTH